MVSPGAATVDSVQTNEYANRCIREYLVASGGAGFIFSPLLNALAIAALEVQMITELAGIYQFPVPKKLVIYKILISLMGSIGPIYFSTQLLGAAAGMTPIGCVSYVLLMGGSGAAFVYAVGKVFQKHFESGGTFLSSDNEAVASYFRERYEEGKSLVPGILASAKKSCA